MCNLTWHDSHSASWRWILFVSSALSLRNEQPHGGKRAAFVRPAACCNRTVARVRCNPACIINNYTRWNGLSNGAEIIFQCYLKCELQVRSCSLMLQIFIVIQSSNTSCAATQNNQWRAAMHSQCADKSENELILQLLLQLLNYSTDFTVHHF